MIIANYPRVLFKLSMNLRLNRRWPTFLTETNKKQNIFFIGQRPDFKLFLNVNRKLQV